MVEGSRPGFLERFAAFYAFLADLWNCPGATPTTLEVTVVLALIREAGARRDVCQGEVAALLQELLRPPDAARDAEGH